MILELLPISTVLTLLTNEFIDFATAAQDVLSDKETCRVVTTYITEILPVLGAFNPQKLESSLAAKEALNALHQDIRKARNWLNLYHTGSKFYQLVHCRNIVKEAQQVINDIGKSLALLSLASSEVSMDILHNAKRLGDQMCQAEFQASQQKLQIIEKLELGIKEHRRDQAFANELIREIAWAVGVPVEDSELRKELGNLIREKEEATQQKMREESVYLEQIIALLSLSDAAHSSEVIIEDYRRKRCAWNDTEELPQPLGPFQCPLTGEVMKDPVSVVATGQTYERSAIEEWFNSGNVTDPIANVELYDLSLRPNHKIRECIEEWAENNHCIRLQIAKRKLASNDADKVNQALRELCDLCVLNYKVRYWISEEDLVFDIILKLKTGGKDIKRDCLLALHTIVAGNDQNKKQLLDAGGIEQVIRCLARDISISEIAVTLLLELLLGQTFESLVYYEVSRVTGAVLLLVTLYNGKNPKAADSAKKILEKLCDKDINVVEMAKANWFTPLIERLHHGSPRSKLVMAEALSALDLTELGIQTLGVEGAILPLVKMLSGNMESRAAALKALQALSCLGPNKKLIAEAGAVPLVLEHLFSGRFPINVMEAAAAILENILLTDGNKFLLKENGEAIDLGKTIDSLLLVQENSLRSSALQKHALLALLGLVSPPAALEARLLIKESRGLSVLLPLLECVDAEVRNAAVRVICCLAGDSGEEISLFLTQRNMGRFFVRMLDNDAFEIQAASAELLANLPLEESRLTAHLVDENAVSVLIHVLSHGNPKVKESTVGALIRFTLPSDIELQKKVVEQGLFPLLRGVISSGTPLAKARAAHALQNLSESTLQLCVPPTRRGCFHMFKKPPPLCRVHPGTCEERTTFCLVKAEVVPDLVILLRDRDNDSVDAAVDALSTLVHDVVLEKGAKMLHEEKAILSFIELLSHGSDRTKEKALTFLRQVFKVRALSNYYGAKARAPLVELATHGNNAIAKQAAQVLGLLQVIHAASEYF